MVRMRQRLALAGLVALLVAGVILHTTQVSVDPGASGSGADGRGAFVVEPSLVSAVAVVGRVRSGPDAELLSVIRLSTWPLLAFVLVALAGTQARARSWLLSRPDWRSASPLRGSMLAARRAPPASV